MIRWADSDVDADANSDADSDADAEADDDANADDEQMSIPHNCHFLCHQHHFQQVTDNANRASQGNVAMQLTQPDGQM